MERPTRPIFVFFSVVLVALAVKLFVLDVLFVSGPSMSPAISHGTLVAEYRLAWGIPVPFSNAYLVRWGSPQAGDVVIYPINGRYVVKRCLASEGIPLEFSNERGYSVRVGDATIPLDETQYKKMKDAECVPDGMLFALGDNMAESRDSRDYGFVSIDSIRGKALWK
jgi:signal peptidase I